LVVCPRPVALDREQSALFVIEVKPIQDGRVVGREKKLPIGISGSKPVSESPHETRHQSRIQGRIEVVDGEQVRRR
jgi:hypothetical protein